MLLTNESSIDHLIIHQIGNKGNGENLLASKKDVVLTDELKELLTRYFLVPFKNSVFNNFHHSSDITLNEVNVYAKAIFNDTSTFFLNSINIAKHLYEQSTHPNINPGELYVVYFRGCLLDDEEVDAIGLFKSENKDTFLKVLPQGETYDIHTDNGVNIHKLDKGCLIFDTDRENGYKVCIIDNTNKGEEARYWREDFLNVKPRNDSFHFTKNYLDMCKDFVTDKLPTEFEISKTDQIDMLNRSVDFFKKKENFDFNEFSNEVIQQTELIDTFKEYKKQFQEERELPIVDEFEISTQAVKKQAKIFKSVLKLDKNFHIYIHGNKELIESGMDTEKGMKFYKIYYREES